MRSLTALALAACTAKAPQPTAPAAPAAAAASPPAALAAPEGDERVFVIALDGPARVQLTEVRATCGAEPPQRALFAEGRAVIRTRQQPCAFQFVGPALNIKYPVAAQPPGMHRLGCALTGVVLSCR